MVEVEDSLVQSRVPYIHSREGNAELEYTQLNKDTVKTSVDIRSRLKPDHGIYTMGRHVVYC